MIALIPLIADNINTKSASSTTRLSGRLEMFSDAVEAEVVDVVVTVDEEDRGITGWVMMEEERCPIIATTDFRGFCFSAKPAIERNCIFFLRCSSITFTFS